MQRKTRLTLTETNKTFLHRNKESGLWAFPKRKRIFPLKMIYCMFLQFYSLNLWIKIVRFSLRNLQPAFYPVAALAVCTFHQSWELAFFSKKLSQFTKKKDPVKLLINNFYGNLRNKQSGATICKKGIQPVSVQVGISNHPQELGVMPAYLLATGFRSQSSNLTQGVAQGLLGEFRRKTRWEDVPP